jgi:hypothetical protein
LVCKTNALPIELPAQILLGGVGIEPTTSALSEQRSATELATQDFFIIPYQLISFQEFFTFLK